LSTEGEGISGDGLPLADIDELGLRTAVDGLALALGLDEADGDWDPDGDCEGLSLVGTIEGLTDEDGETDWLSLELGETEADGLILLEADPL